MPHSTSAVPHRPQDQSQSTRLAGLATRRAVSRQRRVWSRRVGSWDQHGSAGLSTVTAAVVAAAAVGVGRQVVDLGCGQGQVSLPLARLGAEVLGIDVSPEMVTQLIQRAGHEGIAAIAASAIPIEELTLPSESVDLIVSSYALHHPRDADKARLVREAIAWLRPGGRLMVADIMFGRGGSSRDRAIIGRKVALLARKGPGGWLRIAKNAARYLLRVHECPVSMTAWTRLLCEAGFADVTATPIVAEAGLVTGVRPAECDHHPAALAGLRAGEPMP